MSQITKQKQHNKKEYRTDLRIDATPHQVAQALVRGGAPRQAETTQPDKKRAE